VHSGRVLLVSDTSQLVDQVLQLAGIVGIEVLVTADGATARAQWREPDLVLIAAGLLAQLQGAPRRRNVLVLDDQHSSTTDQPELWSRALTIGAEGLLVLPGDDHELIRRLRDVAEGPSRQGLVVGVLGACGGAGASTLAMGLALAASAQGDRVLAVDADPLGGGSDLVLGAEDLPGVRWPDLLRTSGRLSAATLDYALPHLNGVAVLAHARTTACPSMPSEAVIALLDTAERGYDLVVVDVGRCMVAGGSSESRADHHVDDPEVAAVLLERIQVLILLLPNRIAAVAAGMNLVHRLGSAGPQLRLVVRQRSGGLSAGEICDAVGLAATAVIAEQAAVASAAERGEFTGAFLRSCRNLYRQLQDAHVKAGRR